MKFILIAAVALLALAHGSSAQDTIELEKITKFLEDMRTKVAEELTGLINNPDLAQQAQTFLNEKRAQLDPMFAKIQEQLSSATSNIEEQLRPLAANVQTQAQPIYDSLQQQMEAMMKKIMDQTQAIGN